MKISKDEIEFKEINSNLWNIFYNDKLIKFWSSPILIPFGLDFEYNKYLIRVEIDENNTKHIHLKKTILKFEKLMKEKFNINEEDFKSCIKKRENKKDLLELRLKTMKDRILTKIEFIDKDNNYLKTIYDLPKHSNAKIEISINNFWDYRNNNGKCGLLLNALKIIIL